MKCLQTLKKAQTLLAQKTYAWVFQATASALKDLLVELYNELLSQSPPTRQGQHIEAQEQTGVYQPLQNSPQASSPASTAPTAPTRTRKRRSCI